MMVMRENKNTNMRKAIDDAEVIDLLAGRVVVVGCSKAAIISVKGEMLPLLQQFFGHLTRALIERDGLLILYDLPQLASLAGILHLGVRAHEHAVVGVLLAALAARLEDLQRLIAQILLVAAAEIVDANQ